jgi:alanyl-tRNA synthetase
MRRSGDTVLDGTTAFTLYDTYGFPFDLTADVLRGHGLSVDEAAFDSAMDAQRTRARAASQFKAGETLAYDGPKTRFDGYDTLSASRRSSRCTATARRSTASRSASAASSSFARTPFYAESGGQVGDRGELSKAGVCLTLFAVEDTQKIQPDVVGHVGEVKTGELRVGDTVAANVDHEARGRTMRNHSATHLMHKALREVLGAHVQQKGSLVDAERTRFDFRAQRADLRRRDRARRGARQRRDPRQPPDQRATMPIGEAQKLGAMMLFGEKYGDDVRVLDIGSSRELCGGTHVKRTGDIGMFKVTGEGGVAAGVRRIEATTGKGALAWVQAQERALAGVARR